MPFTSLAYLYPKEGDHALQLGKDEFQYLPDLADLPELDLPMELPSLPGIFT